MNATVAKQRGEVSLRNREKGEVNLKLAGKVYTFKLGTQALEEAQELLSTPARLVTLDEMRAGMIGGRLRYIRAVMWAGLQKYHRGTTPEQVCDILDNCNQSDIEGLMQSLGVTMQPTPEDAAELAEGAPAINPHKAQTRKRGAGASSTSKPAA